MRTPRDQLSPAALEKQRAQDRRRQQQSRARRKALKPGEHRLRYSQAELATIKTMCAVRGGPDGPYEVTEYLLTLVRQDAARWADQQAALHAEGPCGMCGAPLPGGCGGLHKGDGRCFYTARFAAEVAL